MKKVILSVAMLCATSMLFAQGLPQAPNCIDCDINPVLPTQIGSGSNDNVSDVDQRGVLNIAHVLQEGAGNYSKIDQDGMNFGNGGHGNKAYVSQQGFSNHSDIDHNGDNNTGDVNQIGWSNYTKQVVGVGYAENNMASSSQEGELNVAYQNQYFDNNTATIIQRSRTSSPWLSEGKRNYAKQYQNSGSNGAAGSVAMIEQRGNDNKAEQTQNGSNNDADTFQNGFMNMSVENQTSVSGGTVSNTSDVDQFGRNNKACVNQDAIGANNMSEIVQRGTWNTALVDQTATATAMGDNNSFVNQTGRANSACVTQYNQSTAYINF